MQVSLSASGTAAQIKNSIASQVKNAGKSNAEAWPALVSLRDYIGAQVDAAEANGTFTISASVSVALTTKPASTEEPKAAESK